MGPGEEPRNSTAKTRPWRWERRGHRCPRQTLLCPPEGPRIRRTSCTPITYHSDSGPPASRLKKPRCTGVSRCGKVQLGFRPSPTGLQSPAPLCREASPLPRPRSLRGLSRPPSEPPAQRAAAHPGCPRPHLQGADFRLPALTPGPHPSPLPVMTTAPSSPRHEQGQETTVGVAFPYAVGITGAFENLWGAGNPLLDTSTFGYHFGVMLQGHSSPIIPSLDTLRVYENLRERLQRWSRGLPHLLEVLTQTDHPALSREAGSSSGQGGGGGMQRPGSLPRTAPENTKTTQQPLLGPASRTMGLRWQSLPPSLYLCAHSTVPPHPGPTLRKTAPAQVRQVGPPERPALCLGTQLRTRQAMPGIGLSL